MKVRFSDRHVRVRLSLEDVRSLEALSVVTLEVAIDPQPGNISLRAVETQRGAHYEEGVLNIDLPREWVSGWADNEVVGYDFDVVMAGGTSVRIVVEKDFPCEHSPRGPGSTSTPRPKRMT